MAAAPEVAAIETTKAGTEVQEQEGTEAEAMAAALVLAAGPEMSEAE